MKVAVVVLAGLAAVTVAMALRAALDPRQRQVRARLRGYALDVAPPEGGGLQRQRETRLAETHVIQEAAEATGRVAERVGLLARIEGLLERGDLPLRASEVLFLYVVALGIVLVGGLLLIPDPLIALLVLVLVAVVPVLVLQYRARKRLTTFAGQLPDLLHLLSGALRAGFSFMQALDSVSKETTEPARKEMSRVVSEAMLGRPAEDALDDVADRMESEDMRWTVIAVRIQREVGGNLAEVLETVATTMRERERLRREVRALTAEARFSAVILGMAPFAFFLLFFLVQREFIDMLLGSTLGLTALLGAGVLSCVGFFWLSRIMKIEA